MLPLLPELISADSGIPDGALAVVRFGESADPSSVPMPQLGPRPLVEIWRSSLPVTRTEHGSIAVASNGAVLIGSARRCGCEPETAAAALYESAVDAARQAGYPYLLRMWNHVGGINECERGLERYRHFSAGRHAALTRLGFGPRDFPAASAVGMQGSDLALTFLASRVAGLQVENPRQVPAYEYPAAYGPRSPSFARATVAHWDGEALIFVAGTSSVVGHATLHGGDVVSQLEETLRNLERIVAKAASRLGRRAGLDRMITAKTYLRRPADYESVAGRIAAALPNASHLFLQADICRADLLIEIEGVARLT